MTPNEQKQQLSVAYIHAVAARAGYACQATIVDDDSVDVTIAAAGQVHDRAVLRSPRIEIQLKASNRKILKATDLAFSLPIKNYEDLRHETMCPRLLVVFLLPKKETDWLVQSESEMITRHCAYWQSLLGLPEKANKSNVTIRIPRANCLTVARLRSMMENVSEGKPL